MQMGPTGMTAQPTARNIVDELIEERAPGLFGSPVGRLLMQTLLFRLLHYRTAVELADVVRDMSGREIMDLLCRLLAIDVRADAVGNLPAEGPVLVAPNHPTGIADGIVVYQALKALRPDVCFFANRDALRVAPRLAELIIPVEWGKDKRSHASSRDTLVNAARALKDGRCVVLFPAGRLAYMSWRGLAERPWQPTIINMARRFQAPLVPMSISGRNSPLFYAFSQLSNELRDVTLFREVLNKRGYPYRVRVGTPIGPDALKGDPQDLTEDLQYLVEHEMPRLGAVARLPRLGAVARLRRRRQRARPATLWGN